VNTYEQFKTDEAREKSGVWFDYGAAGKFLLARAGGANKAFEKKVEQLSRPHRRMIKADMLDNDQAMDLMRRAYADAVVLGWENVTGPDGQPLLFSPANALKLFTDLPDLFSAIMEDAGRVAVFRAEIREAEAKNS